MTEDKDRADRQEAEKKPKHQDNKGEHYHAGLVG